METIIFLETYKSGSSREAVRAAERLGYYTVVFTRKQKRMDQRAEYSDVHEMYLVDLDNYEEMKKKIRCLQEQGKIILSIVSFIDSYVHTAAVLTKYFCNNRIMIDPILKMENKILTRTTLQDTSFNTNYASYKENDLVDFMKKIHLNFPIIMKLPDSTGSKDVLLASNLEKIEKNVRKLKVRSLSSPILFEEYVDGPQYLVETLISNGKVNIIAVIQQEISKQERFIITGYLLLLDRSSRLYNSLTDAVCSIIKKFGMKDGACHLELRYHRGNWKLIEINPRMSGGAMNKMIEVGYGINLAEQIIQISLGKEPNIQKKHEKFVFTQYLTVPNSGKLKRVTGIKRALRHEGVDEVYLKPKKGTYLYKPLSMGHRYAYVLASSHQKEKAIQIAKTAAKEIKFHIG
ncbi:ATP-grasp domain-containing protein [Seinonella peptonophila]|uniref:ATP-grasp domain-containing protein n=1 Tax=Seinonella peptonophila TaxID=112248 RepID=A0A1M5ABR7_9BACL|nr:ATP-grasp domain-containing protein [Seinonella peptonophila]SHF27537.1 ATP-grasp domain-containing protein [Seinonella peptonophila]